MEEISGYNLKEVKGKDWFQTFLLECDRERIRELFLKGINDIPTVANINPIVTKNGELRYIEWYDRVLKDENGAVTGLVSVGQDITERREDDEKIKLLLAEKEILIREIHHRVKII